MGFFWPKLFTLKDGDRGSGRRLVAMTPDVAHKISSTSDQGENHPFFEAADQNCFHFFDFYPLTIVCGNCNFGFSLARE